MTTRENNNNTTTISATALIILLPILALASSLGMAFAQILIFLACIYWARKGLAGFYYEHWHAIRWIIGGFAGYFLISLVRALLTHAPGSQLDGPLRLLLGLSCIGFAGWLQARLRGFWIGLCIAAIASGAIAVVQCHWLGMERATGFTHHAITFGDLSLALGLMSICGLGQLRHSRLALLPLAALAGGLLASLLSGSRGGWIALPLVAIPLLRHHQFSWRKIIGMGLLAGAALAALLIIGQHSSTVQRSTLAYTEALQYYQHGDASTSVGIRLELWKASWMMFSEHPLLGVGRGAFQETLHALMLQGRLQDTPAQAFSSSHNDALHFLATGGLLDFSFLLLMYGAPLAFFIKKLRSASQSTQSAALAGVVLVICFMTFGLTDVMFWLMAPKMFYVMMLCTLIGFCLQKHSAGQDT